MAHTPFIQGGVGGLVNHMIIFTITEFIMINKRKPVLIINTTLVHSGIWARF